MSQSNNKKVRHILALSGGKDSSALAVYLRDKVPNLEYVFCDTGEELPETYTYLEKLQNYLCADVTWIKSQKDFKYYYDLYGGVLPDANTRWCTRMLKLKPFETFIGSDHVSSYVGIRADEPHRTGYISTKPNIKSVFPFVEDNLRHDDIIRLLDEAGLGLPEYYDWRSRSGCYFCFFQQKNEWVGLLENHPHLFQKAMSFERVHANEQFSKFTWSENESLEDLCHPNRIAEIKREHEQRQERLATRFVGHQKLKDLWNETDQETPICAGCNF